MTSKFEHSKSQPLSENKKTRIQTVEMEYMKRVFGVAKKNKISIIRVKRRQPNLSWRGHLQRLENVKPVKRIWEDKISINKKQT